MSFECRIPLYFDVRILMLLLVLILKATDTKAISINSSLEINVILFLALCCLLFYPMGYQNDKDIPESYKQFSNSFAHFLLHWKLFQFSYQPNIN